VSVDTASVDVGSLQAAVADCFVKEDIEEQLDKACDEQAERVEVAKLLEKVDEEAAYRYEHCHEPGYGWVGECPDSFEHPSVYVPFSCMLRICPDCSVKLSTQAVYHYRAAVQEVMRGQWYRVRQGWRLRLFTLTTQYELSSDVGDRVLTLLDAARDLFRGMWEKVEGAGAMAGIEVGPNGLKFHVHVLAWTPFPNHQEVKDWWKKLTGQTYVNIEVVGNENDYRVGNLDAITKKAVRYCAKYMMKCIISITRG
jgi:hypothetical protein